MKTFVIVMVAALAIEVVGTIFFLAIQQRERSMTTTALDGLLALALLVWGVWVLGGA